ncbi:MAG: oxidoreductase [Pseudomonadota bacterium]
MNNKDLFLGLRALAESNFPKRCLCCGRQFDNAAQFLKETQQLRKGISGLKQSKDDDNCTIIEVYRNCPCGSTLMDFFSDRRDLSELGISRRKKFGKLMDYLVAQGLEPEIARDKLLNFLQGQPNDLLDFVSHLEDIDI